MKHHNLGSTKLIFTLAILALISGCSSKNAKESAIYAEEYAITVTGARASALVAEEGVNTKQQFDDKFESAATNPVKQVSKEPVSTFSADVDTASYSYIRQRLNNGYLPQKAAVRLEEMLNYFSYAYDAPSSAEQPFSSSIVVHDSPWAKDRKLIHIGLQGYQINDQQQPDSNLVFLLDVSGSMNADNKLPLVKKSLNLLLGQLKPSDTISIVVYAGAAGMVLEPTLVKHKHKIIAAMDALSAGGSTAGGAGIDLAYRLAEQNFKKDAINRIILATDGDFNVGNYNRQQLQAFVERKRETGIYLSVLGFGQGNYHDHMMQSLAQNGNGIAAYIDTLGEAQKVLVHEATSSLFPIATDLKLQLEFNPATVSEYRLLGYETRHLEQEDFNNDKVDAGDIGSGHSVTAIYEVTLVGSSNPYLDKPRYQQPQTISSTAKENELGFLKIRYKLPGEDKSVLKTAAISQSAEKTNTLLLQEVKFASAVAGFAQQLKDGKYLEQWTLEDGIALALEHRGEDEYGYRSELVQLMRKAQTAQKSEF